MKIGLFYRCIHKGSLSAFVECHYTLSYIKVIVYSPTPISVSLNLVLSATCAFMLALLIVTFVYMLILQKKQNGDWTGHENYETLGHLIEFPMRVSCRELSIATSKFSEKLGEVVLALCLKGFSKMEP